MSFLAEAWADAQKPRRGGQLHLLRVIASHFRDEEGYAWPSNKYLAGKTLQSEATVERNLAILEEDGFIRRETRYWGTDGGARRHIYLNFDAAQVEEGLRQRRAKPSRKAARLLRDRSPQNEGTFESPDVADRSPHSEGQVPSNCGSGPLILGGTESLGNPLGESSPPIPPAGGRQASPNFREDPETEPVRLASDRPEAARPGLDAAGAARFERLWAAYPPDGLAYSDRPAAERLFAGLDAADQDLAVTAAGGYRAQLARTASGKPIRAKALHGWLRQRRFANLRVVASSAATPPTRVFVRDGTSDWAAWEAYDRSQGRVPRNASWSQTERAMGWWFASARPPASAA